MRPPRFRIPLLKTFVLGHAFKRMSQPPRKPRHRALRLLLGLLGLGVLALMIAFGLFVGLAMLAVGALLRLWTLRRAPTPRANVTTRGDALDGDFRVLRKPALPAR